GVAWCWYEGRGPAVHHGRFRTPRQWPGAAAATPGGGGGRHSRPRTPGGRNETAPGLGGRGLAYSLRRGRLLGPDAALALAVAAADGVVVHQHAAGAAGVGHARQAVAGGLDHLAALGIARGAGDADAGVGHLALAQAHREVVAADRHAVEHHVAATHAAG